MKKTILGLCCVLCLVSCKQSEPSSTSVTTAVDSVQNTSEKEATQKGKVGKTKAMTLSLEEAEYLADLPLACIQQEYPNKLDHVMTSKADIEEPHVLHPAFYGCFDWHSSVHGHWSLVRLLKIYPHLSQADTIKQKLLANISPEHIAREVAYFKQAHNAGSERTYGWAWLLKLAEELHTWKTPLGKQLEKNLQPLTAVMVANFKEFLPKLTAPMRVGEHSNTAFAMVFAYDYAVTVGDKELKDLVSFWAKDFYLHDKNCPIAYEPSGSDFLSPCLEEVDLMARVLSGSDFKAWLKNFMPQLYNKDFSIEVGHVSDRTDGKLVHLDGLNFSRAWVFYDLANQFPELAHLRALGDRHLQYSLPHILKDDSYMGSHWLGSFALYAFERR